MKREKSLKIHLSMPQPNDDDRQWFQEAKKIIVKKKS